MEILLYVIEISQFQDYLRPYLDKNKEHNVTQIQFKNVPNSAILEETDEIVLNPDTMNDKELFIQNAKIKAHKLFEKYIDDGTTFEINISGKMRDVLTDILCDLDALQSNESIGINELYTIFEESVQEMMTLQSISFERFRKSEAFDAVKALLTQKKEQM